MSKRRAAFSAEARGKTRKNSKIKSERERHLTRRWWRQKNIKDSCGEMRCVVGRAKARERERERERMCICQQRLCSSRVNKAATKRLSRSSMMNHRCNIYTRHLHHGKKTTNKSEVWMERAIRLNRSKPWHGKLELFQNALDLSHVSIW